MSCKFVGKPVMTRTAHRRPPFRYHTPSALWGTRECNYKLEEFATRYNTPTSTGLNEGLSSLQIKGNRFSAAMGVEGGLKCVKFLLFFFNFIFWLCGLALVVVGILVQVTLKKTLIIKDASTSGAPIVLIVVGVVIFFIAFFGCCGAWKENYCMITTFAIFLSVIIIVEIAAAIAGYIFRKKVNVVLQDSLKEMIASYQNSTEIKETMDYLQKEWHCCGLNSSTDWKDFKPDMNSVPDSCCVNVTKDCGIGAMKNTAKVHQEGCEVALEAFLKKNIQWVIVAALVIAFLQIMGIVFACLLMRGIRSGYEVM
ncbi:hypothetical protein Q8A73_013653 [Channa argus]|nr:hypothetical protein Q8A73_013653 [Channa argus]